MRTHTQGGEVIFPKSLSPAAQLQLKLPLCLLESAIRDCWAGMPAGSRSPGPLLPSEGHTPAAGFPQATPSPQPRSARGQVQVLWGRPHGESQRPPNHRSTLSISKSQSFTKTENRQRGSSQISIKAITKLSSHSRGPGISTTIKTSF